MASKTKYFYTFANWKDGEYSHPTVTVYRIDPQYPTSHDEVLSLKAQSNQRDGFKIRKSYALYLDMNIGSYYAKEAFTLLTKMGFMTDSKPFNIVGVIKSLRKLKIERYTSEPIFENSNGWMQNELTPRKFRKQAALYWQALKNGLTLKKAA